MSTAVDSARCATVDWFLALNTGNGAHEQIFIQNNNSNNKNLQVGNDSSNLPQ